jgi:ArsR family transcriptional regulator, arsenate/arsenite/antimonite-responsive transcriptional repressor
VRDYPIHQVLKAMGEPTRIRLLNLLRMGDICVCDLQAVLGVSQSNVSRHLAGLRHVGLVNYARRGLRIIYSLSPASTLQLSALHDLLHRCCSLEPALQKDIERFRQAVAEGECRVESGSASTVDSPMGVPQIEGNPA